MAPPILHRVLFSTTRPLAHQTTSLQIRPALLQNYTRHRVRGCDYPAILPNAHPGACVRGTYVEGLMDSHVWRLDVFEGDEYERVRVRCKILPGGAEEKLGKDEEVEGEEVEAETYVWKDKEGKGLDRGEWDFEKFRREKMGRWVGSEEYAEVDQAVERVGGDPTGGRGMDGDMAKVLNREGTE